MKIYVDGSCFGNNLKIGSKGGFGVYISQNSNLVGYSSHETTNNRMEILSVIFGLAFTHNKNKASIIFSDSAYAVNSYNSWIGNWKKNNWKKSDGKEVLNQDLFHVLLTLKEYLPLVQVKHIKREMNTKADLLARSGSMKSQSMQQKDLYDMLHIVINNYDNIQISSEDIKSNPKGLFNLF